MAPVVKTWSDLASVSEAFYVKTHEFLYPDFVVSNDDDVFYHGKVNHPKLQISFDQFMTALQHIPDEDILPEFLLDTGLALASNFLGKDTYYIKRPRAEDYEEYKKEDILFAIPALILDEAQALELVSKKPHPGLIGYHGCRVR